MNERSETGGSHWTLRAEGFVDELERLKAGIVERARAHMP